MIFLSYMKEERRMKKINLGATTVAFWVSEPNKRRTFQTLLSKGWLFQQLNSIRKKFCKNVAIWELHFRAIPSSKAIPTDGLAKNANDSIWIRPKKAEATFSKMILLEKTSDLPERQEKTEKNFIFSKVSAVISLQFPIIPCDLYEITKIRLCSFSAVTQYSELLELQDYQFCCKPFRLSKLFPYRKPCRKGTSFCKSTF